MSGNERDYKYRGQGYVCEAGREMWIITLLQSFGCRTLKRQEQLRAIKTCISHGHCRGGEGDKGTGARGEG